MGLKIRLIKCDLKLSKEEIDTNKRILKQTSNSNLSKIIEGSTKYNRPEILKLAELELKKRLEKEN